MRRYFIAVMIFLMLIVVVKDIAFSGLAIITLCIYFIFAGVLHNIKNIHNLKKRYWTKKMISIIAICIGLFSLNFMNTKLSSFEKVAADNMTVAIVEMMRKNIDEFYRINERYPYKNEFLIIIYGGKIYDENNKKTITITNIGEKFIEKIYFSNEGKKYIECGTAKNKERVDDKINFTYNERTGEIKFVYGYTNTKGELWFQY